MANILEYLAWRGDLSFAVSPFNEVDNLVLSELAFVDFGGILTEKGNKTVTLREVAECLSVYREEDLAENGVLIPKEISPLFYMAAESVRFRDVALCGFESLIDVDSEMQFAAAAFLLGDGSVFVSYRGTDDTLVGWKEDFNMSFLSVIPAQRCATRFLDHIASLYPSELRIGGHSKGGNLAVYASATVSIDVQRRILAVYNNDGPGFLRDFLDSEGYARIRDRVRTIVPDTSIVGMLLEHEASYTVVKSTQTGLFQHDGFSWEVLGTGFVVLDDRTRESKFVDRTLKAWVASIEPKEREEFVEALYKVLSITSASTLSDLHADKEALWRILNGITPEQRGVFVKTLRLLLSEGKRILLSDREEERRQKKAISEKKREEIRVRFKKKKADRDAKGIAKKTGQRSKKSGLTRGIRFRVVTKKARSNTREY